MPVENENGRWSGQRKVVILVAPQKDGSLRFLQLAVSPEGMRTSKDGKAANKEALRTYCETLQEDERVVPFFLATGNL